MVKPLTKSITFSLKSFASISESSTHSEEPLPLRICIDYIA